MVWNNNITRNVVVYTNSIGFVEEVMEIIKQYIVQIVIALISSAIIPTVFSYLVNRKKAKVEITDVLTGSALKWVTGLQDEVDRANGKVDRLEGKLSASVVDKEKLEKKIDVLDRKIEILERQLADKEQRIRVLEAQLIEKDTKIKELQTALYDKNGRIDALEKRIKELEEAEQRHIQHNHGQVTPAE
jgi:chromosome segregation ATPase